MRYDYTYEGDKDYWAPYIIKQIAKDKEVDCGLYCEQYNICDFFVHTRDSACMMGSFQNQGLPFEKNGSDLIYTNEDYGDYRIPGLTSTYRNKYSYNIYVVYKSKFSCHLKSLKSLFK